MSDSESGDLTSEKMDYSKDQLENFLTKRGHEPVMTVLRSVATSFVNIIRTVISRPVSSTIIEAAIKM